MSDLNCHDVAMAGFWSQADCCQLCHPNAEYADSPTPEDAKVVPIPLNARGHASKRRLSLCCACAFALEHNGVPIRSVVARALWCRHEYDRWIGETD